MNPPVPDLDDWIRSCTRLCKPARIVWLDGSVAEKKRLEREAVSTGELLPLHPSRHPGCFYHRSDPDDVARVEHLTFICARRRTDVGPTNNWMAPAAAYRKARRYFNGAMKGRTMYVIPFIMGRPDSPFAKVGVELTDSLYVALNMRIMAHVGDVALDRLRKEGRFTRCLHSKADLNPRRRLILHFPEDDTVWSVGSGYGGNALLGKKCLALRIASWQAAKEGWLAEHMLLIGVQAPGGETTYVAASFPSACGKTNLAMLVPPERYRKQGYRVWTIGDDIAWLRPGADGRLYGVNPEAGLFGVAPGTNARTNPNAVAAIRRNTIFTNVLLRSDGVAWWEDGDGPVPSGGINWRGDAWRPGLTDDAGRPIRAAHPNSRFTAPIRQCPSFSRKFYDPAGVPISAILFGGRHETLMPLVFETRSWAEGVYAGASLSSEVTAAQVGRNLGRVRRDPMAMLPFCGLNMGRYLNHWLNVGAALAAPPRIFHVNWFRRDPAGAFLWPGFGENFRVLKWIVDRCGRRVSAKGSPIGYVPRRGDVDLRGLHDAERRWDDLFRLDGAAWRTDLADRERFFSKFGADFPAALWREQRELARRIELI